MRTVRRLALIVTGFTLAHSLTLSLAALNIFSPPARLIEPAIALSIVQSESPHWTGGELLVAAATGIAALIGFVAWARIACRRTTSST